MVVDGLVVVFGCQNVGGGYDTEGIDDKHCPAHCTQDEGRVQLPADEEPAIVFEQIGLQGCQHSYRILISFPRRLTTSAIAII